MLYKLALRNITRSRVYYGFYLFILVVFSMLIYSTVAVSQSLQTSFIDFELKFATFEINDVFNLMVMFTYIMFIFFSLYISRFFIKQRSNELALYKLLGLNNSSILKMLGIENSIIFTLGAIIGTVFGIFFGRLFQQLCIALMKIDISESALLLDFNANFNAILLMVVGWLISLIIPYLYINTISIVNLFSKKAEANQISKAPIFSIIIFFITSIYLVAAVGFVDSSSLIRSYISQGTYVISILFTSIICAFTLYKGFFYFIIITLRKLNVQFRTPSLLLSLKHIETDTQQLYKLLAIVSIVVGIMTPFGLAIKSTEALGQSVGIVETIDQFSYITNDKKMDKYFTKAFSEERGFKNIEITYQKVTTQEGTFYLLNQDNAEKLLYIDDPSNKLNINDSSLDYEKLNETINKLSDNELLFIETEQTTTTLPNDNINVLTNYNQSSLLLSTTTLPTTLLSKSDQDYETIYKKYQKEKEAFLKENEYYVNSYEGTPFLSFVQFVTLNKPASINHSLVVANNTIYTTLLETYDSETITMRINIANQGIISNDLLVDITDAVNYFLNQEIPFDTEIIDNGFTVGIPGTLGRGATTIFATLVYSLLFFVLIATTLFRSLENGEKGNYEYKIASLLGVRKISILKSISLEAFMIMIFPFIMGFIVSTSIYASMLKSILPVEQYDNVKLGLSSIISVGLPIFIAIIIIFFIVVKTNYNNVYKKR